MEQNREPLRIGIIGCGRMGRLHSERILADGRARIVAYQDTRRSVAESLRDQLVPQAMVFDTLEALLEETPLDAAIICTPTSLHDAQVLACRRRGLHVLCEKPLADTRERIIGLIEEHRREPHLHLSVAYQRRYWSVYRTLRKEARSGRWGRVRAVTSHNVENWQQTIAGTWRDDPQINWGGFLGDAGSHKIDMLFYLTGLKPVEVFARTDRCGSRVEIIGTVSALLENDVQVAMDFIGNAQYLSEDVHLHCTEADLMVRHGHLWIARNGRLDPLVNSEPESNPVVGFLDALLDGATETAPPACALPVRDFTEAILTSGATGETVRLA